jgi:hypothetical protein
MSKNQSSGRSSKPGASSRNASSARLQQKSGSNNAFRGVAKVNHGNGSFSMRKTGK